MFSFTINNNKFLNEFYDLFKEYVNKSFKFSMSYITNPHFADYKENERLVLIVVNKSVFQNMLSFVKLNDSNMQFSALSCLETAVNSIRLYRVLVNNPEYMHAFITKEDFSMEICETEISDKTTEYVANSQEEFSLKEFSAALKKLNRFVFKNSTIASQIVDNNIYLGVGCGNNLSTQLQNEIRKNLVGAYLSLQIHNKMFFNGGIDSEFEQLEDDIYAKFLEYVKIYSK